MHVSDTNAVLIDYLKSPLGTAGVNNNNQSDPYAIALGLGADNLTADFGYYPIDVLNNGVIGNQVWIETDANGLFAPLDGDVGQAGVTVELWQNNQVIMETTTGASGDYAFVHLNQGDYTVRVSDDFGVLARYIVTRLGPDQGQDDNNQLQAYDVSLPQGGYNLTADFGYIQPAFLGDFVWYDTDKDGIQDVSEPGLPNVALDLYRDIDGDTQLTIGVDELVASAVTDADGGYLFRDLIPGNYLVDVRDAANPNGPLGNLMHTQGLQGVSDPSPLVSLEPGEVSKDTDFGYVLSPTPGNAVIGDTVWYDDNGDGIQQPWEPGAPGVEVCAVNVNNPNDRYCDTTDANGLYLISVPAGDYNVAPTNPPPGLTLTTPPSPLPVSVVADQQYLDADFGYDDGQQNLLGTIGNLVFLDPNKNGLFGAGDSLLPGVSVDLIRDVNGNQAWDVGEPIIATTTSVSGLPGDQANYLFTGLPAGAYLVHISDTNAVLVDYVKSPLGAAGVNNNNQDDPYAIALGLGADNLTADFAYHKADGLEVGVIGNQVWVETDSNGLFAPVNGDVGQAGVTVDLFRNGQFYGSTTTGASGDYSFVHLPAGNYAVNVSDNATVLDGYMVTVLGPNQGQDNNNQLQPYAIALPTGGYNLTGDFGYIRPAAIGDFVWFDADGDALQDVGEIGIPNVAVDLYRDTNNNNVFDINIDQRVGSTVTDADGGYFFRDLLPDTYFVDVRDAPNPNGDLDGLDHTLGLQSQRDPTPAIVLDANEVYKDADFGYKQPIPPASALLGDTVWYDDNGDKFQQPGEPGIPGLQVCATAADPNIPIICETTDSNGHYLLIVPAGTYTVTVVNPPANLYNTTDAVIGPKIITAGTIFLSADFGFNDDPDDPQLGTIGNLVFLDANKNGIFGLGDAVIGGVSVDLIHDTDGDKTWDAGEPIIATVTTNSSLGANNGNYLFTGVPAGDYLVHVSDTNGVLLDYAKSILGDQALDNRNKADPYAIELVNPGDNDLRADFGYYKLDIPNSGVIGNQVWLELIDNGIFEPFEGDLGQHGVTVALMQNNQVVATTTTGASGDYSFLHLPAGNYEVKVTDTVNILAGTSASLSFPNQTVDNTNKQQPFDVALSEGEVDIIADFGYVKGPPLQSLSTIGNLVWYDTDADGYYDVGEPGIGNVSVQLWYDTNNTCALDGGDILVDTKFTAPTIALGGNYRFNGEFIPGNYLALVTDSNNVLSTYLQTVGANQTADRYSKYPQPYCLQNFNATNQGDSNLTADFGYNQPDAAVKISKRLNTPDPVRVGDPISYTIVITNIGNVPVTTLPLHDVYNTTFLTYGHLGSYAAPASNDNADDGEISWSDLTNTFGFDLAPGFSFQVVVTFTARADTTNIPPDGRAPNTGVVRGALAGTNPLPTQESTAWVRIFQPTGVRLGSLHAEAQDDRVVIRWSTASEVSLLGFNVLRATASESGVLSDFAAINGQMMIASHSGMDAGDNYLFVDDDVVVGGSYVYRLEIVRLDGISEEYGLVEVNLARQHLFAPLVIK